MKTISVARLREVLNYDPETGIFTRRMKTRNTEIGDVAGSRTSNNYLCIGIDGTQYQAHRLAIAYIEGEFPPRHVDHKNGIRSDNRYANLRHATIPENNQNKTLDARNTSGFLGARFHKASQRWVANIGLGGITRHLGLFDTPQEAHEAYLAAKARLHTFQPAPR